MHSIYNILTKLYIAKGGGSLNDAQNEIYNILTKLYIAKGGRSLNDAQNERSEHKISD